MAPRRQAPEKGEFDPDVDLDLLEFLQSLTPAERIRRNDQAAELVEALRRAGARHYGFDPRAAAELEAVRDRLPRK